jgi:hypothetical protein
MRLVSILTEYSSYTLGIICKVIENVLNSCSHKTIAQLWSLNKYHGLPKAAKINNFDANALEEEGAFV